MNKSLSLLLTSGREKWRFRCAAWTSREKFPAEFLSAIIHREGMFFMTECCFASQSSPRGHTRTRQKKAEKKKKKKKVQRENLSRSSDRYDNKLLKTSDVQSTPRLLSFPEVLHYCGGFLKITGQDPQMAHRFPHPPPSCLPSMHHPSHRIDLMSWGSRGERKIFQIWYPRCEKLPIPLSTGEQPVATLSCQSVVTITPGEGGGREEEVRKTEKQETRERMCGFWFQSKVFLI